MFLLWSSIWQLLHILYIVQCTLALQSMHFLPLNNTLWLIWKKVTFEVVIFSKKKKCYALIWISSSIYFFPFSVHKINILRYFVREALGKNMDLSYIIINNNKLKGTFSWDFRPSVFSINQSLFGHWLMGKIIFADGCEFTERFANISDSVAVRAVMHGAESQLFALCCIAQSRDSDVFRGGIYKLGRT
jgi:hypothetical protein